MASQSTYSATLGTNSVSVLTTSSRPVLKLPKKLAKEQSSLSKCKSFVQGAASAAPPEHPPDDHTDPDFDSALDQSDADESDSFLSPTASDANIDPRLLKKPAAAFNKKARSSSNNDNIGWGKVPPSSGPSRARNRVRWQQEMSQLRSDVAQIAATMDKIADKLTDKLTNASTTCTCNNGHDTGTSTADSTYAAMMAPRPHVAASSAEEYGKLVGVEVSPDVLFTLDDVRRHLAQKQGKPVDELHPSTVIAPELCTRNIKGEEATPVRQNQIRRTLREVCVVVESLPDLREEEDGMIKTRGIQYLRDNHRGVLDRLVDKLETAIPELQLCADHWKVHQLLSRRLKSLSEKDSRRNKLLDIKRLQVKSEDGQQDVKGKGKMIDNATTTLPATTTTTAAPVAAEAKAAARPRPVAKQRTKKAKAADIEALQAKLLSDGERAANHYTSLPSSNPSNPIPRHASSTGLTPSMDGVQVFARGPPRASSPTPMHSRPQSQQLPSLGHLFDHHRTGSSIDHHRSGSSSTQQLGYGLGYNNEYRPYGLYPPPPPPAQHSSQY